MLFKTVLIDSMLSLKELKDTLAALKNKGLDVRKTSCISNHFSQFGTTNLDHSKVILSNAASKELILEYWKS